ncbi:MAG TPA: sigma-70 family RNA polymerase sigma factor [Pedococcus sp.]|jgi:RNA polymerase sigma factor (sigma-70 family)|nr:sigma-70 family RNA polymerase sigma factor [Pedococcus sp.]
MTQTNAGPDSLATRAAHAFAAYRHGDIAHMDELVDLLNPILWNIARAQGLTPPAAEDAVQTAWLRLVEHAGRIEDPQTVMQWLLVTTKRESWRVARQGQRSSCSPDIGMEVQDGDPGPEGVAELSERQRLLWGHLQTLPHKCRELLRVVAFADRPDYAQVSTALGMPVGSIGPTRGRCLAKLRSLLQGDPMWGGNQ